MREEHIEPSTGGDTEGIDEAKSILELCEILRRTRILGALEATGGSNTPAVESAPPTKSPPPPDAMAEENPEGGKAETPSPGMKTFFYYREG